jgi:hypothetical protein
MNKTHQTPSVITRIRQNVSRWSGIIAVSLLVFSVLLFIWMWVCAYMQGNIPQVWGRYEGNHGPWHHRFYWYYVPWFALIYELRWLWNQVLNLQVLSFVVGLVSIVLKPNCRAAIITALVFVLTFMFFVTHYWLID